MQSRLFTLRNGRQLQYREYGHPDGFPIIHNHGGMVSGLDLRSGHAAAETLGLRVIAPNRPGIGQSASLPNRTLHGWSSDLSELLTRLEIEECGVLGWSMGGQYALALAAHLSQVRQAVVVAGALPLNGTGRLEELHWTDRWATKLCQRNSRFANTLATWASFLVARFARELILVYAALIGEKERQGAQSMDRSWLAMAMSEAFRQPDGLVEECRAWGRPWGFDLADVECPVTIFHGEEDRLIPFAWGPEMAESLPQGRLIAIPDAAHLWPVNAWAKVLQPFSGA